MEESNPPLKPGNSPPTHLLNRTMAQCSHLKAQPLKPLDYWIVGTPRLIGFIMLRFELISAIGAGGMGEFFLESDRVRMDMEDIQPLVAINVLKTQQLSHPNLVTVYDFDRNELLVYITTDSLKGESLEDYLEYNHLMPVAQAPDIINKVTQGLAMQTIKLLCISISKQPILDGTETHPSVLTRALAVALENNETL